MRGTSPTVRLRARASAVRSSFSAGKTVLFPVFCQLFESEAKPSASKKLLGSRGFEPRSTGLEPDALPDYAMTPFLEHGYG